jgi:DNA-binding LacI/PurR family transcriptional regulator
MVLSDHDPEAVASERTAGATVSARDPRQVSMADVARLAGVSHQTVSRVLNGHPSVREETRARIVAAIRQLDYRPNSAARALATGRSRTVGVVSFDIRLYGPASTLHAIDQAAQDAGYFVSVVALKSLDRASVRDAIGRLRNQAVDGIIVIAPEVVAAQALADIPPDVPAVAVEGLMDGPIPVVAIDQHAGAAKATQHLLDLGHRTVWHIAGPDDWFESRARTQGWLSTLQAAGARAPHALGGDWSPRSGYEQAQLLPIGDPDLTAVFVANDQMALGVLRAFREAGVDVPTDISVVGFDDIPEAAYFTPPLTTVRQEFSEVGRRSVALLLRRLEGEPPRPLKVVVDADLIVRASTAPPR